MDVNAGVQPNIVGNIEATNSPLVTNPAYRGAFDLVVLEHVPTFGTRDVSRNVLDNCTRALAPGGELIIMTAWSARSKFDHMKTLLRTYGYTYRETDPDTNHGIDLSNKLGFDLGDFDARWVLRARKVRTAESPI